MGRVKEYLMDMENYAYNLIEEAIIGPKDIKLDTARNIFLSKYPNQARIFDNCLKEYSSHMTGMLDVINTEMVP